jgi:LPPG:FO 2-phospho-L-lactate transferase
VIGVEVSAEGVGRFYGARKDDGILDGWLIHQTDPADIPGVSVLSRNILMTDDDATAAMVAEAVELAGR